MKKLSYILYQTTADNKQTILWKVSKIDNGDQRVNNTRAFTHPSNSIYFILKYDPENIAKRCSGMGFNDIRSAPLLSHKYIYLSDWLYEEQPRK